jgi:hypothetical protein
MTVKELVLNGLENLNSFEIDLGVTTKKLNNNFYETIADFEIESYYLSIDKETNQPIIIIKLADY